MGAQLVVGILTPAISFLFAIVFFVFWRRRPDLDYVKHFAFSYALVGVAFGQSSVMPEKFSTLSLVITCGLAMASIASTAHAFMSRLNLKTPVKALISIVVAGTAATAVTGFMFGNVGHMAAIGCLTASLMFVTVAVQLDRTRTTSLTNGYIPKILYVTSFSSLLQSVFIWSNQPVLNIATFQSSSIWIILNMVLTVQLCAIAVAIAMICVSDSMTIVSAQAMTDELSGLQRRERFEELAHETMDKAKRAGVPVSFVICDLDHFKNINDTYGHLAGDEVIKAFGAIMRQTARSTDILGRIGGEEFALMLWNADKTGAKLVAQQLRSTLSNLDLSEVVGDTTCTASFGIAQWDSEDEYRDLFAMADKALYLAKHSGRDCVKVAQAAVQLAA